MSTVVRFERLARSHPWQAAAFVAAVAALLGAVLRMILVDDSHLLATAIVTFVGVWLFMACIYRFIRATG
jgi:DUF883 C-terminal glycine zipper region